MFTRSRYGATRHDRGETATDSTTTCCLGFHMFSKKSPPNSECYLPTEKCTDLLGNEFAAPVRLNLSRSIDIFHSEEPPPSYSPPRGNMDAIEEEILDDVSDLCTVLDSTMRTEDTMFTAPAVEVKYTEQELIVQQMWANQRQCTSMQPSRPFLQRIKDILITDLSIGTTYRRGRLLGKVIDYIVLLVLYTTIISTHISLKIIFGCFGMHTRKSLTNFIDI